MAAMGTVARGCARAQVQWRLAGTRYEDEKTSPDTVWAIAVPGASCWWATKEFCDELGSMQHQQNI